MPTRNRAVDLRRGLRNALDQAGVDLELILSDNASSDETPALGKQAAAADARVRFFRQDQPLGLYEHHNFCLDRAQGRYVGFFHDHDLHAPDFVRQCVDLMEAHPRVGLVGADWRLEDEHGNFLGERRARSPRVEPGRNYIRRTIRSGRSSVAIPGALMRREALAHHRLGGAKGFGDFPLWFRIAEDWEVGHLAPILWTMRQSADAQSATTILQMTADYLENIEGYLRDLAQRRPWDKAWAEARQRDARRFAFWALVYEWILQLRAPEMRRPGQTLFQMYGYRLDQAEKRRLEERLTALAPAGWPGLVRILLGLSRDGLLGRILGGCLSYPEIFRRMLRLQ